MEQSESSESSESTESTESTESLESLESSESPEENLLKTYEEAVKWIVERTPLGIHPGLERMQWLMEQLDHPERRLKFIHVAGTNGKGSTCALISKVLLESGYDVGTFTSPYLYQFNERVQYNGNPMPESEVVRIVNMLRPLAVQCAQSELGPPTRFELCTAMALVYFAQVSYPDYVVMEAGMGGRLDSTNVITPVLSIITNVGHDHMDILGNSLEAICMEKAGIIKPGVPVVSAVEQQEAVQVLNKVCTEKRSTLYLLGKQFNYVSRSFEINRQCFDFHGIFRNLTDLSISLNGEHQLKNAAVAVMALEVLRQYDALIVDDDRLSVGLLSASWPGRLELVSREPLVVLDGAHNPEGASSLAQSLRQLYGTKRMHMMIGMLKSKDHRNVLRQILPLASSIIVTEPDFINPLPAEQLATIVHEVLNESSTDYVINPPMEEKGTLDLGERSRFLQNITEETKEGINSRGIISPGTTSPRIISRGITTSPGVEIIVKPNWKEALDCLLKVTAPDDLAVVTGTLYMVSDVRSWMLYQEQAEKGW